MLVYPGVGVHKRPLLMSLHLLLQQCAACFAHINGMVCVKECRWPKNCSFIRCSFKYFFKAARSVVYSQPSILISISTVYIHMQKHRRTLLFRYEPFINFLTSVIRHEERDTILKGLSQSYYANNTANVRHITLCFWSRFIFIVWDLQNLTAAATVENLTLWQRTPFSAPMAENSTICLLGPMSTFNWLIFKILKFSAHLFWAWRHPHSSLIFCLRFIMTMVIVTSFVHKRKLHQLTTHLNS